MTWSDFILRGTLVLAAAFLTSYAFARASAALRHLIWTAAFLGLLLLPAALRLAPKVALSVWPAAKAAATTAAAPIAQTVATSMTAPVGPGPAESPLSLPILPLYLAGLLVMAARFAAGAVRTSRLVRGARSADYTQPLADGLARALGIARPVRALESAGVPVPMTWGTVAPVVLLPESARDWPAARLHAVVLHELVHVRRHDLMAQMTAQAACCLYWFHP